MPSTVENIPTTGTRTTLAASVETFLSDNPTLHLGGNGDFHDERRHHLEVFGFHNLPKEKRAPIGSVHFAGVRGRYGTIPVRLFYPRSWDQKKKKDEDCQLAALIYFHGGCYTVGSVDKFENGLRLIAEEAGVITIGVEYHLAPEWTFPVQLDEYEDVLTWARSAEGRRLGIDPHRVLGGGDEAGGNMTAALTLRLKDAHEKGENAPKPLKAQILLYPETRMPFNTPALIENTSGLYLDGFGIFFFKNHYLRKPSDTSYPRAYRYMSPGMEPIETLGGLPPAAVFTCGFDPLRDVGVEYASKLQAAGDGNRVVWRHYPELTHGFLQMAPWSEEAMRATKEVAKIINELAYD